MENYLRIQSLGLVLFSLLLVVREADSDQCLCGKPIVQRVSEGKEARVQDYPWLLAIYVRIKNKWVYRCAATLIHSQWAVTASHCLQRYLGKGLTYESQCFNAYYLNVPCFIDPADFQLALESSLGTDPDVAVSQAIHHPLYIPGRFVYDIALLKLAQPVQCPDEASLICVTEGQRMDYPSKPVTLAGWGESHSNVLGSNGNVRETQLQVIPKEQCPASNVIPGILCTNGKDFVGTSCKGDSGGPLMYNESDIYYITGVVSHGTISCHITGHLMFTSLTPYLQWIKQYVPLNEVQKDTAEEEPLPDK